MILDSRLNFKRHLNNFFNYMILSHMVYGLCIWSQTNQCIINQVECLCNRALNILDKRLNKIPSLSDPK